MKKKAKKRVAGKVAAKVTPFLWLDGNAEEAANFYVSVFRNSKILRVSPGPDGKALSVQMIVAGQRLHLLNGGPHYKLTPAFSLHIEVETQEEIDFLWDKLLAHGGEASRCGWLDDRFGVTWQVIPSALPRLLFGKDAKASQRAMAAMLTMQKLDVQKLKDAYAGRCTTPV